MFRATTKCTIQSATGAYDKFGQPTIAAVRDAFCAVGELEPELMKTSVRADSSGSRSYAEEVVMTAKLMFSGTEDVNIDDRVEVLGQSLRVEKIALWPGRKDGCVSFKEAWLSAWRSK